MKRFRSKKYLIIAVLIIAGAYWYWQNYQNTHYLRISEWHVTLPITAALQGATYHMSSDGLVYLSTKTLDNSKACQDFYNQARPGYYFPSFQYLTRLSPGDITNVGFVTGSLTAKQAAQKYPNNFKAVGGYIYEYNTGSGKPCAQQSAAVTNAFHQAYLQIR